MFNLNKSGYVYKVTTPTGEFYIGCRTFRQSNGLIDIGRSYFTSSSNISFCQDFKKNPEKYTIEILYSGLNFYIEKGNAIKEHGIKDKNAKSLNIRLFYTDFSAYQHVHLSAKPRKNSNKVKVETKSVIRQPSLKVVRTPEEKRQIRINRLKMKIADQYDTQIYQLLVQMKKLRKDKREHNLEQVNDLNELKQILSNISN